MNKKQITLVAVVLLIGILIGFLLSRSGSEIATPAPVAAIPTPQKAIPSMVDAAKPESIPAAPVARATAQRVALPLLPPAPVPASSPTPAASAPPALNADQLAAADAAFAKVRQVSRQKAILNNLRILSSSAQMYMLEHGVTSASYDDLVGTGTDKYIHAITPVIDEDYQDFNMSQSQTQISIVAPDGTEVIFNN